MAQLHQAEQVLLSSLDFSWVVDQVTSLPPSLLNAQGAVLVLLEELLSETQESAGELVVCAVHGEGFQPLLEQRISWDASIAGQVMQTGAPWASDDIQAEDSWHTAPDIVDHPGAKSLSCVPLMAPNRTIGTLTVYSSCPFNDQDIALLASFAGRAAIALENASRHAKTAAALDRSLQQLKAIEEIDHELGSPLDSDRVITMVLKRALTACGADSAVVGILTPGGDQLDTRSYHRGEASTGSQFVVDQWNLDRGILGRTVRTGEPAIIADVRADADYTEVVSHSRSEVVVPIKTGERILGVLGLERGQTDAFTEDDLHFMEHLAQRAALAIESARLYERVDKRLQERVDQLTALQRTSREMNATLDQDRILQLVLDSAIETTGATHGNVMLRGWDTDRFSILAASGYSDNEREILEERLLDPDQRGIIFQVIATGRARMVKDASHESTAVCARLDTQSALSVPIFYAGETVGLINLRHTKADAFDMDDLSFLQALAEQAAIAVGNAKRFEEQIQLNASLKKYTDQMDGLLEVSRKLRADVPLTDTLEEIAYAIQETVEFDIVLISVIENWEAPEPMLRRAAAAGLPLDVFEEAQKIRQPLSRYEKLLRERYRRGSCYFLPFQEIDDWGRDLDLVVSMPEVEQWAEGQWHSHDMLLAPLRGSGGRLLGHISVDEPQDGMRPSYRTLEALAIFANQAAIAVENTKLYGDTQRRADNLALLNELSRALAQTVDPEELLDTVAKGVGLLLECDLGIIFQADPAGDKLHAVASYGIDLASLANLHFAPGEGPVGRVASTGTPLLIPDTARETGLDQWPSSIGSMVLVPITAGQQLLGVLWSGCEEAYGLAQSDQMLLSTLADQAAVALESARLFATTQQAAMRLASLNEIGRRVASQLKLEDILDATVHSLSLYLGYVRVGILLIDEKSDELYVAAANQSFKDVAPLGHRQKLSAGLIGTAATTGEMLVVQDTSTDERAGHSGEWSSPASISVPIKIAGHAVGVLQVEGDRPHTFSEDDTATLRMVADQLANAIQNAHLFELSNRRVAELATINEIGRAISSALDTDQLFELIFNQVSTLLDTRNFHIALYDPGTETIHVKFLVEHGQRQDPVRLSPGQGLTSHLIATGEPILLNHGTGEFLERHGLTLEREPAKSWLGVPMIAEDRVIGAMAVQSFEREGAFDVENLELLSTIAGQAAIAFQNATLFEERNQRITELSVLNQVAQAVSSTLELEDLLNVIYEQISLLMDTTNFFIALYDAEKDQVSFPFVLDPQQREEWHSRRGDAGLVGQIIRSAEPLFLPSGTTRAHRAANHQAESTALRSWLGVPMIAKDQVLGVIAVQSYDEAHVYNESHLHLLSTVAAQAAVAIRNAQLFRQVVHFSNELEAMVEARTRDLERALAELTEERDRVQTLYRITSELGTSLELERVLHRALQLLADALNIQHGTITLLDQETGQLDVKATLHQLHWRHRKGERTPLREGAGLAGWVLQNRRPTLIHDTLEDSRWMEIPDRRLAIRSAVAAPLSLGGGDILGVLTLGHTTPGHFSEDHLQLVTAAASQVAIAVNNSDLYAFITDQAERLGSMLQAQQAEGAKNSAILESIADGVLVLNHNGRVLLANPAAEEMLGFSAMAIQGEHFRHMLGLGETSMHRDLVQGLYTHLRQRLEMAEKEPDRLHTSGIRLKAESKVLAVNFAPLIIELGGVPGLVAALRDVSREAEVERMKNEFISTVSHELRTPMTSIKGYTDLLFLGMAGGLSDAQRDFLQIIKSNADRLTALVNDILDISRIETGRLRLNIEALDLSQIISQVVLALQEQYREAQVELQWQEPSDLPMVRGDAARITQVLNNLLANACHYTPAGGRVVVSLEREAGFLRTDVRDTGIGIAPEDLPRIFDRFYRVDHPLVQEASGTGLGLSIVKMFVELLGGETRVESKLGEGSVFGFTLPLTTTELAKVDTEQIDRMIASPSATLGRRSRILVVEDDRDLALLLRRQLEEEGYHVLLAGSGQDALWLAREEKPQLITLDLVLPDMDGFAVLEQLKENPVTAPIPVVIISITSEIDKGYALGAVDYVVKPFDEEKLLSSIQQVLAPHEDRTSKVLVVDDEPDIRQFLEKALSLHGFRVSTAGSGREALNAIREAPPDLVLLDLKLPDMDGYEVIRQLKTESETRPIPIIVITASVVDKERDRVRVLGLGAQQFMTKPLSIEILAREIQAVMEDRQT